MSLYSDLGVKEGATYDEIRTAYLRLAKEVHPDKVQNERERVVAEERMSRLNQIMDVLSHDEKRAEYDAELTRQRAASDARVHEALALQALEAARWGGWPARDWRRRMAWIGVCSLAALGVGTVLVVISLNEPGEPPGGERGSPSRAVGRADADTASSNHRDPNLLTRLSQATERSAQNAFAFMKRENPGGPPNPAMPEAPSLESVPQKPDPSRDALMAEARRALETPPPPSPKEPAPPRATVSMPVHREVANVVPAEPPRTEAARPALPPPPSPAPTTATAPTWGGLWRYTPDAEGQPIGKFAALNIEMELQDVGGRVNGVYRAQYRVTGAVRSGDVDLRLNGISFGKDWLRGVWSGNGGAYGQFELKRKGNRVVEMSWWTTKLGNDQALASGSARLLENAQ